MYYLTPKGHRELDGLATLREGLYVLVVQCDHDRLIRGRRGLECTVVC